MKSLLSWLRSLTIPTGAGDGTPRTVIGPDVPAELSAYYGAGAVLMATISYAGNGAYHYDALILGPGDPVPAAAYVRGFWTLANIIETAYEDLGAGPPLERTWYLGGRGPNGISVVDTGNSFFVNGAMYFDGTTPAERAIKYTFGSAVDAAASGVIPASVLSGGPFTWKANTNYRVEVGGLCSTSLGTNRLGMFIQDNVPKTILNMGWFGPANTALQYVQTNAVGYVRNSTGSDYTSTTLDVIAAASAGTAVWRGSTDTPRFVTITELGANPNIGSWSKNIG